MSLLAGGERMLGLREEKVPQPIHMPTGPAVARAVNQPAGVGLVRIDDRSPKSQSRIGIEQRRRVEGH